MLRNSNTPSSASPSPLHHSSLGANRVGRTLYAANPVLPGSAATVAKVNRVVFGVPLVTERFWSLRVGAASGQLDRDDRDPVF
jgi:hypothetical protein